MTKGRFLQSLLLTLSTSLINSTFPPAHAQQINDNPPACTEPFCSYAPPRLTGNGMAEAAREIINAAKTTEFISPQSNDHGTLFDAFRQNDHFKFLSPFLVAERKDDPRLIQDLDAECIDRLTKIEYEDGQSSEFSGPIFLYDIEMPEELFGDHIGVLVFGGASDTRVLGLSFRQRVEQADSMGLFYLLESRGSCDPVFTWSIGGRNTTEFVGQFSPRVVGIGSHNSDLFIYSLQSFDLISTPLRTYSFFWLRGAWSPSDRTWLFRQSGAVLLSDFPSDFNPFAAVNDQEALP
jgi:hypothetical protein